MGYSTLSTLSVFLLSACLVSIFKWSPRFQPRSFAIAFGMVTTRLLPCLWSFTMSLMVSHSAVDVCNAEKLLYEGWYLL
jgi:hypothetical protein